MARLGFAKHAKELREKAGLTQAEVAKCLKLSTPQMVSNWERGMCYPPLVLLKPIASLYQVTLEDLGLPIV
jgi:transcriptional regulator with XRE-family HTH domain